MRRISGARIGGRARHCITGPDSRWRRRPLGKTSGVPNRGRSRCGAGGESDRGGLPSLAKGVQTWFKAAMARRSSPEWGCGTQTVASFGPFVSGRPRQRSGRPEPAMSRCSLRPPISSLAAAEDCAVAGFGSQNSPPRLARPPRVLPFRFVTLKTLLCLPAYRGHMLKEVIRARCALFPAQKNKLSSVYGFSSAVQRWFDDASFDPLGAVNRADYVRPNRVPASKPATHAESAVSTAYANAACLPARARLPYASEKHFYSLRGPARCKTLM